MSLPRLSVRNPVTVNLIMWGVILGGVYSMFTLTRELFPAMDSNILVVSVVYPGATPDEIEKSITLQVERSIQDLKDLKETRSTIIEGSSTTVVTLNDGADAAERLNDVRGSIDQIKPFLPAGAEDPVVMKFESVLPVIGVIIAGDVPEDTLRDVTIDIRDDLLNLPGITRVAVNGVREREIWVELDPNSLEEHELTFTQVGQALAAQNLDLPGGQVKTTDGNIRIRTRGEREQARELSEVQIRTNESGASTRLGDVATVKETFEDRIIQGRFGGKRAAQLIIYKGPDGDALKIADRIKKYVVEHPTMAADQISLSTTIDLSRFVAQRLDLLTRNAGWGLVLVGLTLAVFLDLRVAFWVAAGLPISIFGTLMVMQLWGMSINLMTMFGLIVVLGLIVDDAIVIGENVFTKMREGLPFGRAAIDGTREVTLPVFAAIVTTVAAFLPLAFIEGQMGTMMAQLPLVMIAALSVSLLEAFVILPAHLGHRKQRPARFPKLSHRFERVGRHKHRILEEGLPRLYEPALQFVLRWRYPAMAAALAYALAVAGLVQGGIIPFVFVQEEDGENVSVTLEMAAGTPEERTLEVMEQVEGMMLAYPEVSSIFSVLGQAYDDRGRSTAADPATVGQLTVELLPSDQRELDEMRSSKVILGEMRAKTANIAGVDKLKFVAASGAPTGPDIEVRVSGEDYEGLRQAVGYVREQLHNYQGVYEIEDDMKIGKLEVQLALRPTARSLDVTTRDLATVVRSALYGYEAQRLQDERGEIRVRTVLPKSYRESLSALERLRVTTPSGARVPLMQVASFSTARGFGTLARVNGERAVTVTADVDESIANADQVTTALHAQLGDVDAQFPGVSVAFDGARKQRNEALGSLGVGFPAALLGIYAIIAMLFRSYLQPLIVMVVIPFALVGAVLGHLITGYPFTLLSMIGGVALAGIVVNDSLILVDFVNRARRDGASVIEAVVGGGKARLRAVLLTSLTTISGLAPMMLETSFQAQFLIPMAVSIVFGLGFATVLTLFLLPVLYLILEDAKNVFSGIAGAHLQESPTSQPHGAVCQ